MRNIILPELGDGIEKAKIAYWHAKVGDQVVKGDDIVEVVTNKAVFNISAEVNGIIKSIFFQEGQEAKIGEILAVVEPSI